MTIEAPITKKMKRQKVVIGEAASRSSGDGDSVGGGLRTGRAAAAAAAVAAASGRGAGVSESSDEGSQSVVDKRKYRTILSKRMAATSARFFFFLLSLVR